jgi:hypothetical protein
MGDIAFNWVCPHCEHASTVTNKNLSVGEHIQRIPNTMGRHALVSQFIICPNPDCRKYSLKVKLFPTIGDSSGNLWADGDAFAEWRLVPWGAYRNFPDYVPQAVRDDYKEACSIVELSPKAAATLARRAIQGIVRDFWKIVKATLYLELEELATHVGHGVTQETWECIDVARSVGNIGAHMEKDINLIIDVDPDEAQTLIKLIETLVADTYIARDARQQQHAKLLAIKDKKNAAKTAALAPVAGKAP